MLTAQPVINSVSSARVLWWCFSENHADFALFFVAPDGEFKVLANLLVLNNMLEVLPTLQRLLIGFEDYVASRHAASVGRTPSAYFDDQDAVLAGDAV